MVLPSKLLPVIVRLGTAPTFVIPDMDPDEVRLVLAENMLPVIDAVAGIELELIYTPCIVPDVAVVTFLVIRLLLIVREAAPALL